MRFWPGESRYADLPLRRAAAVSLLYVAASASWVIGSDLYVYRSEVLIAPAVLLPSLVKGLAFVAVTGAALFAVLLRSYRQIEDAHVVQQLRFSQTITALARMIELRDIYTHGHQKRVAQIAEALAARLGLTGESRMALTLAAELHDIGKIGVPENLLNKAGFMTDAEMARIHEHAAIGADLLRGVDFPGPVADIVGQHHERLDGSGYPDGLAGDEIMLEARILAVADAFEAMSAARPYRNAQGSAVALAELRRLAGIKYDARIVAECEAWNRERQAAGQAYSAAGSENAGAAP